MSTIKISYVILAHCNASQVERLVDKLEYPGVAFFIHIDKKSDINPFVDKLQHKNNIYFIDKRVDIKWGHFSQVEAYMNALESVINNAPDSFIFCLSGQDYPIKSNKYIQNFVSQNRSDVYMSYTLLPYQGWLGNGGLDRIFCYNYQLANKVLAKIRPRKIDFQNLKNIARISFTKPSILFEVMHDFFEPRKFPLDFADFYGGEYWVSMNTNAAKYFIDFLNQDSSIGKYLLKCANPDEFFMQTVFGNSNLKITNDCLKYIQWSENQSSPKTFTIADKNRLSQAIQNPNKIFARKFELSIDESIFDFIDTLTVSKE